MSINLKEEKVCLLQDLKKQEADFDRALKQGKKFSELKAISEKIRTTKALMEKLD